MKRVLAKITKVLHAPNSPATHSENFYQQKTRIVNDEYRKRLQSYQVPAVLQHFGNVEGKAFADIGCGDMPLAYCWPQIGRPSIYYATDINQKAVNAGLKNLQRRGIDCNNIVPVTGPDFDFSAIPDGSVDAAFSNSLFSHLTLNSIILCLKRLHPKMKAGTTYMSSAIILPAGEDWCTDFEWKVKYGTHSHPCRDPYHYVFDELRQVVNSTTDFECVASHDYGHPFQRLIEFRVR